MYQLVLFLHVIVAILLIGLVLIQHGKGADIGASFGSGASNTVFGSQGAGNFLFRMTGGLVLTFFVTSLVLSWMLSLEAQSAVKKSIPLQAPISSAPVPDEQQGQSSDKQGMPAL